MERARGAEVFRQCKGGQTMDRNGDIAKVKKVLLEGLKDIEPEVYVERNPTNDYLHVWVISDAFGRYDSLFKRHDIVCDVLEATLFDDPVYPTIMELHILTHAEFLEANSLCPLAFNSYTNTAEIPEETPEVQWLDKISIRVSDIKKAKEFYEALGIPVSINAARKNSLLVLKQLEQSEDGTPQRLDYISFLTTYFHLKEIRKYLKEQRVKVRQQNSDATIQLSFLDLDGNVIKIKAIRE